MGLYDENRNCYPLYFGAAGIDTRPLARAVDIAAELLFTHRQTIDELHFTRDIYSPVAVLLCGKNGEPQSVKTISKSIERLSNQCWDIRISDQAHRR